jgi:ribose transport system substrate-binding protein
MIHWRNTLSRSTNGKGLYLIPILSKTLDVMELLEQEKKPLNLEQIHQRTTISKTTVFRILHTLVHRGYVSRPEDGRYRLVSRPRKLRFGFGGQSGELPFSNAVTESLRKAGMSAGVDLLILDNRYDGNVARQNAEEFITSNVDLVIEFQTEQYAAPIIADRLAGAGIPLVAVDIPHPNAIYFGIDNFRAGFDAGALLAEAAEKHWNGKVDLVVGLDLPKAGPLVQSRITGSFEAIRSRLPQIPFEKFFRLDGAGLRDESYKVMLQFLKKHHGAKHILVAVNNDVNALGAIEAARELKCERCLLVVGHDCIPEAMDEMKRRHSPLVGSVSHEVATYGPRLIHLGLAIIKGESVSPYNYVEHKVVRSENATSAALA